MSVRVYQKKETNEPKHTWSLWITDAEKGGFAPSQETKEFSFSMFTLQDIHSVESGVVNTIWNFKYSYYQFMQTTVPKHNFIGALLFKKQQQHDIYSWEAVALLFK